jgi:hypothetical protein
MWRINSVFLFLLLNFLTIETFAKVIWEEKFDIADKGVWGNADGESIHVDFSSVQWNLNSDLCSFSAENDYVKTVTTSGGRLEALDCDGEAVWYSPWVDIHKFPSVNIDLTARETGSSTNINSKYLKAYYQLNNQEEAFFETNGINEGNWDVATVSQTNLQGDSIRIIVRMNSSYAADKVILDDVRIWTDQPEVVDPNQLAVVGDILISEVLFDPYPGGVDFVELYNQSDKDIRLDHLFLANRDANAEINQQVQLNTQELLFPAKTYLVLSEDEEKVLVFYETSCRECFLNLNDMPAYNNDAGDVVLLNGQAEVVDEMHYSAKMHHSLLVDEEGVSLERISFEEPAFEPSNWVSASAAVRFATPGYENSMAGNMLADRDMIQLAPKAFSPNDDGYNDYLSITYQFENPNYVASLKIFDSKGLPVCDLVKNEPIGTKGEWVWTGKHDDGKRSRLGIYIVWLELFDSNGNVKRFKETCSITDRLE